MFCLIVAVWASRQQRCMWPGSAAATWTSRAAAATTSPATCGAPTATAARSGTRRWRTCPGCPEQAVDAIEAALKGTAAGPGRQAVTITSSVPHGHVAAVHAMAAKLGLPALLGPACRERDLALALIVSRVVAPASKLSTLTWWADTTLGADLGVAARPPMRSTRRWTGWQAGKTRSRRSWLPGTWARRRTRRGWRCSTCPARGWKARAARWPPAATPATARKAGCRSSTGCSPTRQGRPVAVRVLPRQHRRPGRVHRDRHGACGTSSAWPRWSWSATAA